MIECEAVILENTRLAEGVYGLTFAAEGVACRAGQFCMLGVKGFPLRRPIAVCKQEGNRITVCYRVKGEGTKTLSRLKPRETLSVLLPLGNGFYVREEEKRVAVVGGGVGVFPLVSAIRAFQAGREIFAYMGFRDRAAICMEYEMRKHAALTVATDDGSVGFHGTAVQAFCADYENARPDAVLACGPLPMLCALKTAMQGRGVPVYVSLEERMGCGIGACLVCVCDRTDGRHARVCKDGPVFEINDVVL